MKKEFYDYLEKLPIDEFLEQLDDFGDGHYYIHEAAKRIRQFQSIQPNIEVIDRLKKWLEKDSIVARNWGEDGFSIDGDIELAVQEMERLHIWRKVVEWLDDSD